MKVSERDLRDDIAVELRDAVIDDILTKLDVLSLADSLSLEIDAERFPVVLDNIRDDVTFGDVDIILIGELDDALMELVECVSTVLLDVARVHDVLGLVDDLVRAHALVRQNSDEIRESLVLVRVLVGHIIDLTGVEPSLRVSDLRVVLEKVESDSDGLWARGRDRVEFDGGDDPLGVIARHELLLLRFGEIGGHGGFENVLRIGDAYNGSLCEFGSGGVDFKDDATDEFWRDIGSLVCDFGQLGCGLGECGSIRSGHLDT